MATLLRALSSPKKSGSTKKRASRAGTRSVSTLSAAQLERKRANDREAQRAIRQRTKDHIDGLENTISELRRSQEASDRDALAARQRNRELEEENAFMRMKLSEAGLSADLPTQTSRPQDPSLLAPHASSAVQASGANIQRPASTSTSRSFSGTHPGASGSWHQQQQNLHRGSYAGLTTLPLAVPVSASVPSQGLTTWRSHESTQSVSSLPGDVHTPARNASSLPYSTPSHAERSQWPSTTPQYQYTVTEQQHHPQYQPQTQVAPAHAPSQQHSPYGPAPMQSYPPAQHPPQQQAGYHASQMPPQSEFQNLSVSTSPGTYPVAAPGTQSFVSQQQYHVAPMQSTEYQQTHAPVPQQAISAPPYQQPSGEQAYAPPPPAHQQHQSAVHFRDETGRGYSMSHYPSA